jgi:hypothetical protein
VAIDERTEEEREHSSSKKVAFVYCMAHKINIRFDI